LRRRPSRDPIEPRVERTVGAILTELAIRAHENFLRDVLGLVGTLANINAQRNTAGWKRVTSVVNAESSPDDASEASCGSTAHVLRSR
jgi:hypothetical protein